MALNTISFGATDKIGFTDSHAYDMYSGFDSTRMLAGVSREAILTAATMGFSTVSARGGGLAFSLAAQGLNGVQLGRDGYYLAEGADRVVHGDPWGFAEVGTSILGIAGKSRALLRGRARRGRAEFGTSRQRNDGPQSRSNSERTLLAGTRQSTASRTVWPLA